MAVGTTRQRESVGSRLWRTILIYLTKVKLAPGQVVYNDLSKEHKKVFDAARQKEIESLLNNKAITILSLADSRQFRKQFPDHVLKSRYVDRWKPSGDGKFSVLPEDFGQPDFEPSSHEGLGAKSRWCVVGWLDPMIHEIERSAPTPDHSSLYMFMQLSATRCWEARVEDAKTAFLQSKPTTRKQKLACTMPPDGVFPGLHPEQLIQLETEVYGLVSGPAWWRRTLLEVLVKECGYRVNPYDRCVLTLDAEDRGPGAKTRGIIVVEVDDLLESGDAEHRRKMEWLESKFRFGKATELQKETQGTAYAGRRLKQLKDFSFEHTMNDYIANRLKKVEHQKVPLRLASETILNSQEEAALRGTIASINWIAREGRPDAAAAASILSSSFPNPSVNDAIMTNKVVDKRKGHQVTLKVHSIPEEQVRHFVVSDASFDQTGRLKPQHGWLQGVTTPDLNKGLEAKITLISWKSRKLRRKAGSTMLCESISLSTALGALEKQVAMWKSICQSRFDVRKQVEAEDTKGLHGSCTVIASEDANYTDPKAIAIVDAKSVFDASASEQAQGNDDRTALEMAVVKDSLKDSLARLKGRIRWVPHNQNPSDPLTKLFQAHEEPMARLLKNNSFQLQFEEHVLAEGPQHLHRKKTKISPTEIWGADETKDRNES